MTATRKRRRLIVAPPLLAVLVIILPVVLLAGAGNPPSQTCTPGAGATQPTGTAAAGMFAAPLKLAPNHWYVVGATEYGGPSDPTSGSFGSSGVDLNADPNSFAELSLLNTNPANAGLGSFAFEDANALNNLPYGTGIRVRNGKRQAVLYKRDIGYGQGPDQTIPYRIDVWWKAAAALDISKTPVSIELAPSSGAGSALGQLPGAQDTTTTASTSGCVSGALNLTPGDTAQIDPSTGQASAPADAPAAVKELIAAGNELIDKPYVWGGGHAQPLSLIAAGYDCSGSTSFILHAASLLGGYALVSGQFEPWGDAGPGRWVTVYANSAHVFIDVAGVVLDTAHYASTTPAGSGPRWQPASIIAAQINGDIHDGNGGFIQRHPKGL